MKPRKEIKVFLMIVVLLVGVVFPVTVHAEEEIIVDGSKLTFENESEGRYQNVLRGALLASGEVVITNKGNRKINCYGSTISYRICDKIEVEIYLERSSGGGWSSYKDWSYSTTNDSSISRSNTISVPGGYYYRLRGYYACEKAGYARESNSSFTNGIWIP